MAQNMDNDFKKCDLAKFRISGIRIRTGSWTTNLSPKAILFYFIACFSLFSLVFKLKVFSVSQHTHLSSFTLMYIAFHFNTLIYIYFNLFTHVMNYRLIVYNLSGPPMSKVFYTSLAFDCSPIVYLPVGTTRLIRIHLTCRIIFWSTYLDKIPVFRIDCTLVLSILEKYPNGAVKYLVTSVHVLARAFDVISLFCLGYIFLVRIYRYNYSNIQACRYLLLQISNSIMMVDFETYRFRILVTFATLHLRPYINLPFRPCLIFTLRFVRSLNHFS